MSELNVGSSVGRWVAEHPQTADVFEMFNIDYCCGGDQSLEEACWKSGLETLRVHSQLQRAIAGIDDESVDDWLHASLSDLCDHIEQTHHVYLKAEFSRLTDLIAKVEAVHGDAHTELVEVQQHFISLRTEMLPHTAREESVLFPAIRQLEQSGALPSDRVHGIGKPIRTMLFEHLDVGDGLRNIRKAANDFAVPADACDSYRDMLASLRRLENDTHHHIHKENHILFPRVIELESQLASHHEAK
ncbi:MAG: iron-sulfur cluster repair di-iron protein [Pirellulaceae bacterium]|jgi:regulator of cell morphogenesis and NO signaling|nr:iron-sulfur cluster repair di-iron protein [Pirellulaceae bacterium]